MTITKKNDVIIIGAGVIGLACAYELSKRGVDVTVIDRSEPGMGCSYGNAGWITPCFALPLPMPGYFLRSLKWLVDPTSPLYIKPEPSLLLLRWLWRFQRSMNIKTATRSIAALTEISKYSLNEYSRLSQELDNSFSFEKKGLLMIGQSEAGYSDAVHEMKIMSEYGIPGKILNESEVRSMEPAFVGQLKGGVYFPDEAHCEPLSVVKGLAQAALRNGAKIISQAEVFDFEYNDHKISALRTTRGWFKAEKYILATGSWSNALGSKLSLNIPILGGKGYALIVKHFNPTPKTPIMIVDKKIAVTPRKDTVRIAGTLELVNQDYTINSTRVDAILRGAQQCMNVPKDVEVLELWRGLRPCTPDGVPIIGFSKNYPNLLICSGHQMLGLQSAPGTARLATDLLLDQVPLFDPRPFMADRF